MTIDSAPTFRTQDLALKALWQAVDRLDHLMQRLDEVENLEKQAESLESLQIASSNSAAIDPPSGSAEAPTDDKKVMQQVSDRLDGLINQLETLLHQDDGGGAA
ncbi:MAG: hypothetical protein FJX22_04390 [Alphaproteobacteria bacterium]|nr:hypothetical protein [Alphaproteobacteria bacterium]